MIRTRWPWFVFLPALLAAAGTAQDWRDDDAIWGFDGIGGPHRAGPRPIDPPSIRPCEWVVVSATGDGALFAIPWILDPARPAPQDGENGWIARSESPLEAAACAFTTVIAEQDEVRMARVSGARFLVVNGSVHVGDPKRRGDRGVPVALQQGENQVFVVDALPGWELELWKPPTRIVIGTWDVGWPHTTGHNEDIQYPVFNASPAWAGYLHVHYGYASRPSEKCPTVVTEWRDGGSVAPLAMLVRGHYFDGVSACDRVADGAGNVTPVCVYDGTDDEAARELLCDRDPSHARTRLAPEQRRLGRVAIAGRPQARIPADAVLVYGTHGSAEETALLLARARFDQQFLWYACGDVPVIAADTWYVDERAAPSVDPSRLRTAGRVDGTRLVLYGNARTNSAWKLTGETGPVESEDGMLTFGAVAKTTANSAMTESWAAQTGGTITNARPIVGFESTDAGGARLSLALGMLADQPGLVRVDPNAKSGFSAVAQATK